MALGRAIRFRITRFPLNRINPVAQKILQINPWANPNYAGTFNSAGPSGNLCVQPAIAHVF